MKWSKKKLSKGITKEKQVKTSSLTFVDFLFNSSKKNVYQVKKPTWLEI